MKWRALPRVMAWCGAVVAIALMFNHEYVQAAAEWGWAIWWYLVSVERP